jgi:hypothetical protein
MDWNVLRRYRMDLEVYEEAVSSSRRRSVGELRMPATIRQELLEGVCNMAEMKRAAANARKIRNQRQFTMAMAESAQGLEIFCASIRRKVKRTISGSRRKCRFHPASSTDGTRSSSSSINNDKQQQVDLAECWMQQQMPRTSRRATFPTHLVSRNTYRNSLRASSGDDSKPLTNTTTRTTTTTIADDVEDADAVSISDDEDAILVAAVASMTVTE